MTSQLQRHLMLGSCSPFFARWSMLVPGEQQTSVLKLFLSLTGPSKVLFLRQACVVVGGGCIAGHAVHSTRYAHDVIVLIHDSVLIWKHRVACSAWYRSIHGCISASPPSPSPSMAIFNSTWLAGNRQPLTAWVGHGDDRACLPPKTIIISHRYRDSCISPSTYPQYPCQTNPWRTSSGIDRLPDSRQCLLM